MFDDWWLKKMRSSTTSLHHRPSWMILNVLVRFPWLNGFQWKSQRNPRTDDSQLIELMVYLIVQNSDFLGSLMLAVRVALFAKCTKGTVPALFVDSCSAVFICILICLDYIDNSSIPPLSFILLPHQLRNNWSPTVSYCRSICSWGILMPGLGFVSDCFFRWGMIFCEKFRHLKGPVGLGWLILPACQGSHYECSRSGSRMLGISCSCFGPKQCFFDVFWFCMSIGALFCWVGLAASKKKEYQKTITNRSQWEVIKVIMPSFYL